MPGLGPFDYAGVPTNGTSEVQTITITGTPTGGSFKLTFEGFTTAAIAYNANAAAVQSALEALPSIGTGGVTCGGGGLPGTPVTVTFGGNLAKAPMSAITATSSLTGGTSPAIAVTETTPGVLGTLRGIAMKGALLIDSSTPKLYQNTGTSLSPVWTVVGTQT